MGFHSSFGFDFVKLLSQWLNHSHNLNILDTIGLENKML
jgi:hypothetical protein